MTNEVYKNYKIIYEETLSHHYTLNKGIMRVTTLTLKLFPSENTISQ